MKTVFLSMMMISVPAFASQLAVVSGRLMLDPLGDALIYGSFTHIPEACSLQARGMRLEGAAKVSKEASQTIRSCDLAIITLDLANSSFCSDQNRGGGYKMPKLIAAQCL